MFFKEVKKGRFRYYEKYYDLEEQKWKQVSITLSSKTRQAQNQARILLQEKIDKKRNKENETLQEVFLFDDIFQEFLEFRKGSVKKSTMQVNVGALAIFIKKFSGKKLDSIKSRDIQSIFMKSKNVISYKKNQKALLNLFFKYCVQVGYLSENPIDKVLLPRVKTSVEDVIRKKEKFLSKEDMIMYLSFLSKEEKYKRLRLIVEFLYLTGLRLGELLALKMENVDFENRKINVKYTLSLGKNLKESYLSTPKTVSSYRVIDVSDRVLDIIREYRKIEVGKVYIFEKDKSPLSMRWVNYWLKNTFTMSGLEKSSSFNLTSHVLRHSHISLLAELQVPIKAIMERVGHSDERTTISVYTHVTEKMRFDIVEKMEKINFC